MGEGFYLGTGTGGEPYRYDPDDLVTHAVILGMTGSGKTGLGVALLEEAARRRIPALVLDPKGDLTNLLLHFPKLRPEDFLPWVSPDEARKKGISREELAREKAELWRRGLSAHGLGEREIRELSRVGYAVYTPGSEAGIPVSILASLEPPPPGTPAEERAGMAESTASAILSLAGYHEADPLTSRELILLARILLGAWEEGRGLDLESLILAVQRPPFDRLGVFDLETFFPEPERLALAMRLNNLLASPSFAAWTRGVPLDVGKLLFDEGGRPRHAVIYLAHLDDDERMFFVTLLLGSLLSWTLRQSGTESLRALVYFDEVYGYLPPTRKPPSKPPLLRLLKQARAFGVGLALATQNPADLDYKALSNAGTWFVGRLLTQQDKNRLLDGLESIQAGIPRGELEATISGLEKRAFLVNNVHSPGPRVFRTRWVMNYLAGPLGKERIPELNSLVGAGAPAEAAPRRPRPRGLSSPPPAPAGVEVYYLPGPRSGRYRPHLLAQAEYRVARAKWGISATGEVAALVPPEELEGIVPWEEFEVPPFGPDELDAPPPEEAVYSPLPAVLRDRRRLSRLEKDFKDWVYRSAGVVVFRNPELKLTSRPGESREEFLERARREARFAADAEARKLEKKYRRRLEALRKKLDRARRELAQDEAELKRRRLEEVSGYLDAVLSFFGGRRRALSSTLSKHRMSARAAEELAETRAEVAALEKELLALEEELADEVREIEERWLALAEEITEEKIGPYKKDIVVEAFGVAWVPEEGGGDR